MKISKERLKEIIKEELQEADMRGMTDYDNTGTSSLGAPGEKASDGVDFTKQAEDFARAMYERGIPPFYIMAVGEALRQYGPVSSAAKMFFHTGERFGGKKARDE